MLGYRQEKFTKVRVCGIVCDFSDMRIGRSTVTYGDGRDYASFTVTIYGVVNASLIILL